MDPDSSNVDVSEDNVVLVLEKEKKELWKKFMAGLSSSQMHVHVHAQCIAIMTLFITSLYIGIHVQYMYICSIGVEYAFF